MHEWLWCIYSNWFFSGRFPILFFPPHPLFSSSFSSPWLGLWLACFKRAVEHDSLLLIPLIWPPPHPHGIPCTPSNSILPFHTYAVDKTSQGTWPAHLVTPTLLCAVAIMPHVPFYSLCERRVLVSFVICQHPYTWSPSFQTTVSTVLDGPYIAKHICIQYYHTHIPTDKQIQYIQSY